VSTDALEERLRLRLRLILSWKTRAADILNRLPDASPEEFPPNLDPSSRKGYILAQQEQAQEALDNFRHILRERATRFADLARVSARRRERLFQKIAEENLDPARANQEARRMLHRIEVYHSCAELCGTLAEADLIEDAGGPVKLRLCRYEAELKRFGSLNTLLDALEQRACPNETPTSEENRNPPPDPKIVPARRSSRLSDSLPVLLRRLRPRVKKNVRKTEQHASARRAWLKNNLGNLLILGGVSAVLMGLGGLFWFHYLSPASLQIEISSAPGAGFRLYCANQSIRPVHITFQNTPNETRLADVWVRLTPSSGADITGRWHPLDQDGPGPLWTIPPLGSAVWDFIPDTATAPLRGSRLEVLTRSGRIIFSAAIP